MLEVAASLSPSEDIGARALEFLATRADIDAATLWSIDEEGPVLRPVASTGLNPAERFLSMFPDGVGIDEPYAVSQAYREQREIAFGARNAQEIPVAVRDIYAGFGFDIGALIVLPLQGLSSHIGAITLAWREAREFDASDVAHFGALARAIAIGMDNARLFGEVAEAGERLATILDTIDDAFVAVDSEWRYTIVNRKAEEMLGRSAEYLIGKRMDEEFPESIGLAVLPEGHVRARARPLRVLRKHGRRVGRGPCVSHARGHLDAASATSPSARPPSWRWPRAAGSTRRSPR